MIDFHCHLDLYETPTATAREAVERGCYVLAVTTTPLAVEGTRRLVGDSPRIRVAVGLHPELVAKRHGEVEALCRLVATSRYVGEIGLDGTRPHRHSMELQRMVLDRVLQACQRAGGRILTVHSRGAASSVLDALQAHHGAGVAVLHWFNGTSGQLRRAIDLGCWFSVSPAMLAGKKGREIAEAMPQDRVLTETDGPFTRHADGGPMMPWDAFLAERALADLWGMSQDEVRSLLHGNLRRLVTSDV